MQGAGNQLQHQGNNSENSAECRSFRNKETTALFSILLREKDRIGIIISKEPHQDNISAKLPE